MSEAEEPIDFGDPDAGRSARCGVNGQPTCSTGLVDIVCCIVDEHDVCPPIGGQAEANRCTLEERCLVLLDAEFCGVEDVVDRHHPAEALA